MITRFFKIIVFSIFLLLLLGCVSDSNNPQKTNNTVSNQVSVKENNNSSAGANPSVSLTKIGLVKAFELLKEKTGKNLFLVGAIISKMDSSGKFSSFTISGCEPSTGKIFVLNSDLTKNKFKINDFSKEHAIDECIDFFGNFTDSTEIMSQITESCDSRIHFTATVLNKEPIVKINCLKPGWRHEYNFKTNELS